MARRLRPRIRARKPDASYARPGFPLKPVQPRPAVFSAHAGTRISILSPGSVGPSRAALVGALRESCFAATRTVTLESLLRGRGRPRAVASGATGILLEIAPLGPERNRLHRRVPAPNLPGLSVARFRIACAGSPPEPSLAAIRRTRGPQTEPVQGGPAGAARSARRGRMCREARTPQLGTGHVRPARRVLQLPPEGFGRPSAHRPVLAAARGRKASAAIVPAHRGGRGPGIRVRPSLGAAPGRSARLICDIARARAGPAHRVLTGPVRDPRGLREAFEAGDVAPVDPAFPVPQGRPAAGAGVAAAEAVDADAARISDSSASGVL